MARTNRTSVRRQPYISGNTVRKTVPNRQIEERRSMERQVAYENQKKRQQEAKRQAVMEHRVRRNQEKALNMDFPYLLVLTIAAVCALYLCINYLHIQSSITGRIHNIENLEKQVEVLKAQNDALETNINTSVDLDYIFKVATEELGMVYANKDQVIMYDKTESEYVRQYEDIPKH